MNQRKIGLLIKFGLSLSFITIVISVFMSAVLVAYESGRVEGDLRVRGIALAQNLAYNAEYGLLSNNIESLQQLLKGLAGQEDIVYGEIYDAAGKMLAEEKKSKQRTDLIEIEAPIQTLKVERTPEEIAMSPIAGPELSKPKVVGLVKIGVSLVRAQTTLVQIARAALLIGSVTALLGIVTIFFLIQYILIRPLNRVLLGTKKIASGELSHRIKLGTGDEIGEVAASFDTMTDELEKTQKELSGYAKELEQKVAARTQELEGLVAELRKTAGELAEAKTGLEAKVSERTAELEKERASLEQKVNERTAELKDNVQELQTFYDVAVGRELKMIELEKEIDGLLKELNRPTRYNNE